MNSMDKHNESLEVAKAIFQEAVVAMKNGEIDMAEQKAARTIEHFSGILGENAMEVAECYGLIGAMYKIKENYDKAILAYEKELTIRLKHLRKTDPILIDLYQKLYSLCDHYSKHEKAISYLRNALDIIKVLHGEIHPEVAGLHFHIGVQYNKLEDYDWAILYYKKALKMRLHCLGEAHVDVGQSYALLGEVHRTIEKNEEALDYTKKGLNIMLPILGGSDPNVELCYSSLGTIYFGLKQYDEAVLHLKKSIKIQLTLFGENHPKLANNYYNLGCLYNEQRKYREAISFLEKALKIELPIFEESHPNIIGTYENLGIAYTKIEKYEKAAFYFKKKLDLNIRKLGESHLDVATSFNNLGIAYGQLAQYEMAIDSYTKAIEIQMKILGDNHPDLATSYANLATTHRWKYEGEKAIQFYKKALKILLNTYGENHESVAGLYFNLVQIYDERGEFDKATDYCERSLDIRLSLLGKNHPDTVSCYNQLGKIHHLRGNVSNSMLYFEKALEAQLQEVDGGQLGLASTYTSLGDISSPRTKRREYYNKALNILLTLFKKDHPHVASIYISLGNLSLQEEKNDEARDYITKALNIQLSTFGKSSPSLVWGYTKLGILHAVEGQYEKAINLYNSALSIQLESSGKIHPSIAKACINIGKCYQVQGMYDEATLHYKNALGALNYSGQDNLNQVCSIPKLIIVLQLLGNAYREQFSSLNVDIDSLLRLDPVKSKIHILQASYVYFKQAIAVIDYQAQVLSYSSKKKITETALGIYHNVSNSILLMWIVTDKRDFLEEAFSFAERAKSYRLYEAIQESQALQFADIPENILKQEYELRSKISLFETQRQKTITEKLKDTDPEILKISSKLIDVRRDYEKLKIHFKQAFPDYYHLKYYKNNIDSKYIQQKILGADVTLLEYFVGTVYIYIYIVNKDHFTMERVDNDDHFNQHIKTFRQANSRDSYETKTKAYYDIAYKLYQKLIAPIAKHLKEKLIIIPDGILGYLPFEALLVEPVENIHDWKNHHYLIKDHQISYCYSATLLREMKNKKHKKKPTKSMLAFAPYYDGDSTMLEELFRHGDPEDKEPLRPLPNSGEEVYGIQKIAGGDVHYHQEATQEKFTSIAGNYNILHLATHGMANDKNGDYCFLAFTDPEENKEENGILYARDLYNLQLNAEMVVLSACQTGIGELQKGEGIISLARAFTYAGTKSIITSLWSVSDSSTKELMLNFYQHLKNGLTKDAALRQAKLDYIASVNKRDAYLAHPFYWSGFIGVGDMGAVEI